MHLPRNAARIKRVLGTLAMAAIVAAGGSALVAQSAAAHGYHSDVIGHVYVNDNTAGTNTIAGFDRHSDGTLTPLPGSPFAAGGAGTGTITGSQGALQVSSDGRYLLAADEGSGSISVLRILPDGALRAVAGGPAASGGIAPVSIAVHGSLVYVANAGNGTAGANYTGFALNRGGQLTPLAHSTVALPQDSGPGDILFNASGTRLIATRVNASLIDSFVVGSDGRLIAAPGSPFAAQSVGPFGSGFRPTHPDQLFVSNAHAGTGNGSISVFHDASDGTLTPVGASPYADHQTAPCWVDITPDGRYLFTVNTADSTISRFAIARDGALTLLGSTLLHDATGLRPFDLRVAPDGRFAYVVDSGHASVSALRISSGDLSELPSSPIALPAGATPFGIVVA